MNFFPLFYSTKKYILLLVSASVKRFGVSRIRDFSTWLNFVLIFLCPVANPELACYPVLGHKKQPEPFLTLEQDGGQIVPYISHFKMCSELNNTIISIKYKDSH